MGFDPYGVTQKASSVASLTRRRQSNTSLPFCLLLFTAYSPGRALNRTCQPRTLSAAMSMDDSPTFAGRAARCPQMDFPHHSVTHLAHTANPTRKWNSLDLNLLLSTARIGRDRSRWRRRGDCQPLQFITAQTAAHQRPCCCGR